MQASFIKNIRKISEYESANIRVIIKPDPIEDIDIII